MAKGLWRTTFIGGFIAWLWIIVSSWLLPWHCMYSQTFPNEKAAIAAISSQAKEDGLYFYPNICNKSQEVSSTRIMMSISRTQEDGMIIPLIISLIIYFIGGLLVALIIMPMAASSYGTKLFAVSMIGLAIGVLTWFPFWNWWGAPFNMAIIGIADHLISWLLAGLVIAGFIHPKHHKSGS